MHGSVVQLRAFCAVRGVGWHCYFSPSVYLLVSIIRGETSFLIEVPQHLLENQLTTVVPQHCKALNLI